MTIRKDPRIKSVTLDTSTSFVLKEFRAFIITNWKPVIQYCDSEGMFDILYTLSFKAHIRTCINENNEVQDVEVYYSWENLDYLV